MWTEVGAERADSPRLDHDRSDRKQRIDHDPFAVRMAVAFRTPPPADSAMLGDERDAAVAARLSFRGRKGLRRE